jgi:hypothetical protein
MFGEDQPESGFGDGFTANLTAVLETDQEADDFGSSSGTYDSAPSAQPGSARSAFDDARLSEPVTTNLPVAFGMQPLAPIRRPG